MLPVLVYKHGVQMTVSFHGGEADDIAFPVKCADMIVLYEQLFPMLFAVSEA